MTLIGAGALGGGKVTTCARGVAGVTDACWVDLVDKSSALTFTSKLNQSYRQAHHRHGDGRRRRRRRGQRRHHRRGAGRRRAWPRPCMMLCTSSPSRRRRLHRDLRTNTPWASTTSPVREVRHRVQRRVRRGPQYLLEVEADSATRLHALAWDPVPLKSALLASTAELASSLMIRIQEGRHSGRWSSATALPVTADYDFGGDQAGIECTSRSTTGSRSHRRPDGVPAVVAPRMERLAAHPLLP